MLIIISLMLLDVQGQFMLLDLQGQIQPHTRVIAQLC
jgi:hypothetical protein